jgi:hypothetical protein
MNLYLVQFHFVGYPFVDIYGNKFSDFLKFIHFYELPFMYRINLSSLRGIFSTRDQINSLLLPLNLHSPSLLHLNNNLLIHIPLKITRLLMPIQLIPPSKLRSTRTLVRQITGMRKLVLLQAPGFRIGFLANFTGVFDAFVGV